MSPFAPPTRRFAEPFAEAPHGATLTVAGADMHFGKP
jgi:hypothetical protein